MQQPICSYENVSPQKFVEFWAAQWTDKDKATDERYYNPHIGKPFSAEGLRDLFTWKNQMTPSKAKAKTIDGYISRLEDLKALPSDTTPDIFLKDYNKGGAIWRIFLLHCWSFWRGSKYPIYDQHVHRAMTFICHGTKEEISGWSDQKKIEAYVNRYICFFLEVQRMQPAKCRSSPGEVRSIHPRFSTFPVGLIFALPFSSIAPAHLSA